MMRYILFHEGARRNQRHHPNEELHVARLNTCGIFHCQQSQYHGIVMTSHVVIYTSYAVYYNKAPYWTDGSGNLQGGSHRVVRYRARHCTKLAQAPCRRSIVPSHDDREFAPVFWKPEVFLIVPLPSLRRLQVIPPSYQECSQRSPVCEDF
jgi:hypothetical protein